MNTRKKLLNAMYELIAKYGYEKTSIAMISEELGIKKASIYYHFKSKEDLFLSVIDEYFYNNDELFKFDYKVAKEDYRDMLIEVGYSFIKDLNEDTKGINVMIEFYLQSKRMPAVYEKMKEYMKNDYKAGEEILRYGVEIGALDKETDISATMLYIDTIINGIIFSFVFKTPENCNEVWKDAINKLF